MSPPSPTSGSGICGNHRALQSCSAHRYRSLQQRDAAQNLSRKEARRAGPRDPGPGAPPVLLSQGSPEDSAYWCDSAHRGLPIGEAHLSRAGQGFHGVGGGGNGGVVAHTDVADSLQCLQRSDSYHMTQDPPLTSHCYTDYPAWPRACQVLNKGLEVTSGSRIQLPWALKEEPNPQVAEWMFSMTSFPDLGSGHANKGQKNEV